MNQLAHIFITYVVLSFIIPETQKYLLPIALFSFILDLDHIPGYITLMRMPKKKRAKLKIKDYVKLFRTIVQEPVGVITIESIFLLLYIFGIKHILLTIAAWSIFLHWVIDFLTVHTQPFNPSNKKIVCFWFNTKKQRIQSEIVITLISFIVFLFVYF